MPLTYAEHEEADLTASQERARRVKPQFSEGDLVRVAGAQNQAEAEFVQNLLLDEGVPSTVRRAQGFDIPEFLAAGPREVLVPQSGVPTAREVLLQADMVPNPRPPIPASHTLIGLLVGLVVVAVVIFGGDAIF